LKEIDVNHDTKSYALANGNFKLINSVLDFKQLSKRTKLKWLTLTPQQFEIKKNRNNFLAGVFERSAEEKHLGATRDHSGSATDLVFISVIVRPCKFISTLGS
jgi:hypothetical protein